MVFVPENSHLVVLLFLGTGFVLGLAALAFLFFLAKGMKPHARRTFLFGAGIVAVYLGTLLIASSRSADQELSPGQAKYFCEVDCHVAYSVESVTTAASLGDGDQRAHAAGTFYVVRLKTWFDPETTRATRGNRPLQPAPRLVRVVDNTGRTFNTSLEGTRALGGGGISLLQPLRPGDSYETTLVFDLPADAANPRLHVGDLFPLTVFLIGHENSPLHKKTYFRLDSAPRVLAGQNPTPAK